MGVPLYRWMFYFMENPTKNNMRNHSKQHSGTLFCIFSAGVLEWAWHRLSRCRPLAPRQVASRRKNRRDGNLGKNGGFYGVFYGDLMMAKMVFFMAKMVVFYGKNGDLVMVRSYLLVIFMVIPNQDVTHGYTCLIGLPDGKVKSFDHHSSQCVFPKMILVAL